MSDLDLNAAIEAGAKAFWDIMFGPTFDSNGTPWAKANEREREQFRAAARAAIDEALPKLRWALAAELAPFLVQHQRTGPHHCSCGDNNLPLGRSFYEHVTTSWLKGVQS